MISLPYHSHLTNVCAYWDVYTNT